MCYFQNSTGVGESPLDTPDDILNMALDLEESIGAGDANIGVVANQENQQIQGTVPPVVNITQTDQTANFNLEVPGIDWRAFLNNSRPNMSFNNCAVTINYNTSK